MAQFEPYIFIETSEKRPSSISVAGWVANQMKYVNLPESTTAEGLPTVQEIVRRHFVEHEGKCHLYGNVMGFRFVFSPTESIVLDTKGNVLRQENGQFWPRSISMGDPDRVTLA
jgi:hypothetical protein